VPEKRFVKTRIKLHQGGSLLPSSGLPFSWAIISQCASAQFHGSDDEMANTPIIAFYSGTKPEHRGRCLHEIQQWTDDQLETAHDYIQWLFPLSERSGFNVAAPVLTRDSMQEFRTRPELQQKLRVSFLRMLNFYGFEARSGQQTTVTRATNFAVKAAGWLSPSNHNHRYVEPSIRISITITDRERISRWGRTRPSHDPFSRRQWGQSWQCRRSVDCTTATNDGSPKRARLCRRYTLAARPLKSVSELRSLAHACIREFRSPDSSRSANCLSFAVRSVE
jgi:hypothetical protein